MNKQPLTPPSILPANHPCEKGQPMWSVMILVTANGQFLPEALMSILMQEIPENEMQIEVIEIFYNQRNESDINIQALVAELGKGKVRYFCLEPNVGVLEGLQACINRARGRFVHILNANDRMKKGFYEKLDKLFWHYPAAGAAFCCYSQINDSGESVYNELPEMDVKGILPDWLPQIAERNLIQFASMVVKREVYEKVGGFCGPVFGTAWEMWTRIARYYPVAYTPEILAEFRTNPHFFSLQRNLSSQNIEDLQFTMNLIQDHLPEGEQQIVLKRSRRFYAAHGFRSAHQLWHTTQNKERVKAHINKVLSMYGKGRLIYWNLLKIHLKMKFKIL